MNTPELCINTCGKAGYDQRVQNRSECYCGDAYGGQGPSGRSAWYTGCAAVRSTTAFTQRHDLLYVPARLHQLLRGWYAARRRLAYTRTTPAPACQRAVLLHLYTGVSTARSALQECRNLWHIPQVHRSVQRSLQDVRKYGGEQRLPDLRHGRRDRRRKERWRVAQRARVPTLLELLRQYSLAPRAAAIEDWLRPENTAPALMFPTGQFLPKFDALIRRPDIAETLATTSGCADGHLRQKWPLAAEQPLSRAATGPLREAGGPSPPAPGTTFQARRSMEARGHPRGGEKFSRNVAGFRRFLPSFSIRVAI